MDHDEPLACRAHGYTLHDPAAPPDGRPCEWIPVAMLVGVKITYTVSCEIHGNLDGGTHDSMASALADRDDHARSHVLGKYAHYTAE